MTQSNLDVVSHDQNENSVQKYQEEDAINTASYSSPQFIWNFIVALYRQVDMATKLVTSSTYPIFIFFFS